MILGLIALVFGLDPTLQVSALAAADAAFAVALLASAPLAVLLWRRHGYTAVPALVVVNARWLVPLATAARAADGTTQGMALVAAGFALVPLGVLLHRRLQQLVVEHQRAVEADQALAAHGAEVGGPATPATFAAGA